MQRQQALGICKFSLALTMIGMRMRMWMWMCESGMVMYVRGGCITSSRSPGIEDIYPNPPSCPLCSSRSSVDVFIKFFQLFAPAAVCHRFLCCNCCQQFSF